VVDMARQNRENVLRKPLSFGRPSQGDRSDVQVVVPGIEGEEKVN
jgi:hypothetical protein